MENEGTGVKINVNNYPPHISALNIGGTTNTWVFTPKQPLQISWEPKEDITTFELAQCQLILFSLYRGLIMPGQIDTDKPFMRHFNIIDPNN